MAKVTQQYENIVIVDITDPGAAHVVFRVNGKHVAYAVLAATDTPASPRNSHEVTFEAGPSEGSCEAWLLSSKPKDPETLTASERIQAARRAAQEEDAQMWRDHVLSDQFAENHALGDIDPVDCVVCGDTGCAFCPKVVH